MHADKHQPGPRKVTIDFAPKVYKPSGSWRTFLLAISAVLGGFSAAGVWYFGTMHEMRSVREAVGFVGLCIGFLLLSSLVAILVIRSRIILTPDSIESRELFSRGKLLRDDILGRRLQENSKGPASLVLVPRDSSVKRLKFSTFYNFDQTFWDWIELLPDLDQADHEAAQQEILGNSEIGATPADRLAAATNAKRLATLMAFLACTAGAWGWFYPKPYWLVVGLLLILPWLAVAITMRSGGLFRIDARNNDPHPHLAIPFLAPGLVLTIRAVNDVHLLEWRTALYVSICVAFALAAMTIIADRSLKKEKASMFAIILLTTFYGYGASMEANVIFDRGVPTVYSAQVLGKKTLSGKSTSYKLTLTPWGPKREPDEVSVSRKWYELLRPGDTVCPVLHEGALHIRWYRVRPCP